MRIRRCAAVLAIAWAGVPAAAAFGTSAEQGMAAQVNAARGAAGVTQLVWNEDLAEVARAHSRRMLEAGNIFHNEGRVAETTSLYGRHYASGENVAVAGSVGQAHALLMDSPSHYANITGRYTQIGIGVVGGGPVGAVWVTQLFVSAPVTAGGQVPIPRAAPAPAGIGPAAAARPAPAVTAAPQAASPIPASAVAPEPTPSVAPQPPPMIDVAPEPVVLHAAAATDHPLPMVFGGLLGVCLATGSVLKARTIGRRAAARRHPTAARPAPIRERFPAASA